MSTFSTNESTVNSFYLAFYGRPADPDGLKFWSTQLSANNGDMGAIVDFFAASEEAQVRFGTDTVADRITEIYSQLFNRTPDAEGMAFWTNAIDKGHASLADVAMSILGGAQGSDATLSQLRKQAADAFTAKVDADGTEYSGYASIEAARILVRAVTPDATQADLDTLVDAAVSFADTATKTPQVVNAIAVNTTLLALFDTARGVKEPVALAKALADTAKAAAGDPVTLESLLRGGGMDKVLKVMPAKATLKDVVDALRDGGLPAAVDVVYPPTKPVTPTPEASFKLEFASVSQGEFDSNKLDKFTNVRDEATVAFKYSGNINAQAFDYSTDGGQHWQTKYLSIDTANQLIKIDDVFLGQILHEQRMSIQGASSAPENVTTHFQLRATDAGGKTVVAKADLVYDGYVADPELVFDTSKSITELYELGVITGTPQFTVEKEAGAKVEYKLVEIEYGRVAPGGAGNGSDGWSETLPIKEGYNRVLVRQTDATGNRSEKEFSFVLDTKAPVGKPVIELANDTGALDSDGVTMDGTVDISGLETDAHSGWQYSIDGGEWQLGGPNNHATTATLDLGKLDIASGTLRVRQVDAAGNIGETSAPVTFKIDKAAPANTLAFVGISGEAAGVFKTDQDSTELTVAFDGAHGDSVEWRVKNAGQEWQMATGNANGTFTTGTISLTGSDPVIEVRVVDLAGNASGAIERAIDGKFGDLPPPPPQEAKFSAFYLTGSPSALSISLNRGNIVAASGEDNAGLLDRGRLYLSELRDGTTFPTAKNYLDGELFGMMNGGYLRFDAQLQTGLYQLNWLDGAIATDEGELDSGVLLFAGGVRGNVQQDGFAVRKQVSLDHDIDVPAFDNVGYAYTYGDFGVNRSIFTGSGHDVIFDYGGNLDVGYRAFVRGAQDLIIKFDAGNDKISLHDDAGLRIDANRDGDITWAVSASPSEKAQVSALTEGVEIVIDSAISSTVTEGTLETLNHGLNLQDMAAHGDLLILAKNAEGDGGVLYHFVDTDGNKSIDAGELTAVAVFDLGAPLRGDIIVVGTEELPLDP